MIEQNQAINNDRETDQNLLKIGNILNENGLTLIWCEKHLVGDEKCPFHFIRRRIFYFSKQKES